LEFAEKKIQKEKDSKVDMKNLPKSEKIAERKKRGKEIRDSIKLKEEKRLI